MAVSRARKSDPTVDSRETQPVQVDAARLASRAVPLAEAKRDLSELCARAGYAQETILITKHGRPLAAIIGVEALERAAALEDRHAVELLEHAIATSPGTQKVDPSVLWPAPAPSPAK
jgi:prevent-host-death family protein